MPESTEGLSESWATIWEALADAQPDHTAVVIGGREVTWRDYDRRAAQLAGALSAASAAARVSRS